MLPRTHLPRPLIKPGAYIAVGAFHTRARFSGLQRRVKNPLFLHPLLRRRPNSATVTTMSDDASYAAFLDQANQSTSSGGGGVSAQSQQKKFPQTQTVSANEEPPKALREIDATFTSDSDEPFEPVALKFDGDTLDGDALAKATGHSEAASEIPLKKFDAHGNYKQVIDAVRQHGEVKAFRIQGDGARAEYWVVALEKGRIVGVRARAVES